MKREIKFRAWDIKRNKIVHFIWNGIISEYNVISFEVVEEKEKEYLGCLPDNEIILMQYTGLKDTKRIEIYEGDIVQNPSDETHIGEVVFRNGSFWINWNDTTSGHLFGDNEVVLIIGNIYETPELLTV